MAKTITAIIPITKQTDARQVALGAYDALIGLLESLDPADWDRSTECPGWTVADMVGHVVGAAKAGASRRELARQVVWGMRHSSEYGGNRLDAFNALQVEEHRGLSPAERVAALREFAPRAVDGRMRTPGLFRALSMGIDQAGSTAGFPNSASIAQLVDVIYTRDTWLHRVDIARATSRTLDLGPTDARIVEDVVAEWIGRHGEAVDLTLTGPAGGEFTHGDGGPEFTLDAVEFCRILSGREAGSGPLAQKVLF
ncbi:MAG TPA: maleylpyruvate isomerase family mycothiol-dependent enzyme [Arachnia sp.]|nr:maleylpyruvate isomerase family mycothiol-dependent enzyme [Arachnia sp.]HMT85376.1 maleylpyruvate isomerase family mycothiol-dependent enzyme [Arachnia sp.]